MGPAGGGVMEHLDVLHLTTFLQGGAGRAVVDLALAQRERGHRVTVVTSLTPQGEFGNYAEYLDRLRAAGITLHLVDSLFTRDLAFNMRVVDRLRDMRPDVVGGRATRAEPGLLIHAHAAVPAFIGRRFAADAPTRVPVIQTQHGWGINKTPQQAAFDLDMLRQVERVITTSRATARLLADYGAPRATMTVIPCGLAAAQPGAPPADAAFVQALRARGAKIVGCIGSVTPNKNQQLVIEALQSIDDPAVRVVFVGEGSEELIAEAHTLGVDDRVVACGYRPDASRWLPLFDLLAVPSRTEGQGLVVLEAFRARVPVVASHIPALTELIDDGRHGLIFAPVTATALAAAIRRGLSLQKRERDEMVDAARARFDGDYTLDTMVERHEQLYRQVLAGEHAMPVGEMVFG
jgi:glycosyltransferase involved in cell wall biosynthesis